MAQIDAAGELGAPERVQVGVGQAGDQRLPGGVEDLGARVAVRAHLGLAADRDDRPRGAPRPRSRTGAPGRASGSRAPTMARSAGIRGRPDTNGASPVKEGRWRLVFT